jgi:citronellol/citronellal dehydrogenase
MALAGKTLFITGASRGIGLAIALKCARDGANIAIAAKSVTEDPRLPGTVAGAAAEIEQAGGKRTAYRLRYPFRGSSVGGGQSLCRDKFGGIDICVNNASAISLTGTEDTAMKRFDLMHQVNAREPSWSPRPAFLISRKPPIRMC